MRKNEMQKTELVVVDGCEFRMIPWNRYCGTLDVVIGGKVECRDVYHSDVQGNRLMIVGQFGRFEAYLSYCAINGDWFAVDPEGNFV